MSDSEPDGSTRKLPTLDKQTPQGLNQSTSTAAYTPGGDRTTAEDSGGPARRFWSSRRVPAGIVALLCVAGTGLFLYDVAAVRAGRQAMLWRRRLADELATRPLDDPWIIGGASVAMVLGIWLFVLAVTPGLRALLSMRRPAGDPAAADIRAALDRSAAALVLRDRAVDVPGVQSARVDVGRRRITARAVAHFRDLDEVRTDLDAELAEGITELGLARQPALAVHVRRPRKR